jgi:hypothetical protein
LEDLQMQGGRGQIKHLAAGKERNRVKGAFVYEIMFDLPHGLGRDVQLLRKSTKLLEERHKSRRVSHQAIHRSPRIVVKPHSGGDHGAPQLNKRDDDVLAS